MRGKQRFKRWLSTAMALVLAISIVPFAQAEESTANTTEDLLDFSSSFAALLENTYGLEGPVSEVGTLDGMENSLQSLENVENPFQTARLIVKAAGEVDPLNAVGTVSGYDDLHILQFASVADAYDAYEVYEQTEGVEYVQPDILYSAEPVSQSAAVQETAVFASSTSYSYNSWGYGRNFMNMDAYHAHLDSWCAQNLQPEQSPDDVVVAVIDSGVAADHEFLTGRVLADHGWDFVENDAVPQDEHGHGTHVSGIIVDGTYRWNHIKLLPVRVLGADNQGSSVNVALGIRYAAEQGARVINMSIGGTGTDYLQQEAINDAVAKGVTVVVGAGNDNADAGNTSPACLDNVITVASAANGYPSLSRSSFSNYGDVVDITAPGTDIYSSIPPKEDYWGDYISYNYMSGTSMATPHVAAAAALLLTRHPSYSPAEVELRLKQAATIEVAQNEIYISGSEKPDGISVPNMLSMESLIDTEVISDICVSISRETATCYVGQSFPLAATSSKGEWDITWTSSDDSIAAISNGKVSCYRAGTVTLTAYSSQNPAKTASCTITVVEDLEITPLEDFTLPTDGVAHVQFTTNCDPSPEMTWSISDGSIAQLYEYEDAEGNLAASDLTTSSGIYVKGLNPGDITLTATVNTGNSVPVTASCTVTVEDTDWYDESISEYHIETVEDMLRLDRALSYGSIEDEMKGKTVYLDSSLDLTDTGFSPISSFDGTFDGQGNSLIIAMKKVGGNSDALFGSLGENAVVKNLDLHATITTTETMDRVYIGGIAAYNEGVIENCTVSGNITAKNRQYVGGVAGYSTGTISDCVNSASISGKKDVGGIAGYSKGRITDCENTAKIWGRSYTGGIVGTSSTRILDCVNTGDVTAPSPSDYNDDYIAWSEDRKVDDGMYMGGIAGYSDQTISNCENQGHVQGEWYVGGICGKIYESQLDTCQNSGSIFGSSYVGGICGVSGNWVDVEFYISDCINAGFISGGGYTGGICGSADSFSLFNCVNTADISWIGITENEGYVGGICGSGSVYNCINYGNISGYAFDSEDLHFGGIAGSGSTIENCLNTGTISMESDDSTAQLGGVCGTLSGAMKHSFSTGSSLYGKTFSYATLENNSLCTLSNGKYTLKTTISAGDYAGKDLLQAMNAYVLQDYMLGDVYDEHGWPVRLMQRYCFWENRSGTLTATAGAAVKHDNSAQLLGTFDKRAAADDQLLLTAAAYRDGKMIAADCKEMQNIEGYLLWMDLDTTSADELKLLITDRNWKPWSSTPSQP